MVVVSMHVGAFSLLFFSLSSMLRCSKQERRRSEICMPKIIFPSKFTMFDNNSCLCLVAAPGEHFLLIYIMIITMASVLCPVMCAR